MREIAIEIKQVSDVVIGITTGGGMGMSPEDRLRGATMCKPESVIGVGYPAEFNLAVMGIIMGGHVRVGLEDNIFIRRRTLATNAQLVQKVVRLANELESEIATPDEARAMLGLKGKDAVGF